MLEQAVVVTVPTKRDAGLTVASFLRAALKAGIMKEWVIKLLRIVNDSGLSCR